VPVVKRVTDFDKANPGASERATADALGIPKSTVHDARVAARSRAPDETTIDNPRKGKLWDDQDDRGVIGGSDGG
jgi:hypothetical protein